MIWNEIQGKVKHDGLPDGFNLGRVGEHGQDVWVDNINEKCSQRDLYPGNPRANTVVFFCFLDILSTNLLAYLTGHGCLDANDGAEEKDLGVHEDGLGGLLGHAEGTAHKNQAFECKPFETEHQGQGQSLR